MFDGIAPEHCRIRPPTLPFQKRNFQIKKTMSKLTIFDFITLNGFYKGVDGDISWHRHGQEEGEFSAENFSGGERTLLFGRVTYEMMVSFWPTADAKNQFPDVAQGMNSSEKIVFSRTLKNATWHNTRIVNNDPVREVKKLKAMPGKELVVLGSGSILTQLANENLIDEYQLMVDPVILAKGTGIFSGITKKLDLTLTKTRTFHSGVILLSY